MENGIKLHCVREALPDKTLISLSQRTAHVRFVYTLELFLGFFQRYHVTHVSVNFNYSHIKLKKFSNYVLQIELIL